MSKPVPVVGVGMPLRGTHAHVVAAMGVAYATQGRCNIIPAFSSTSLLPFTFNNLWTGFLNRRKSDGITHFAMLHDDVCPVSGWLDTLLDVLEEHDADAVSAVVPIKDGRGLTSTAVEGVDEWNPRRLTLKEVYDLPETFAEQDVGGPLLLNTGCWVCRLDRTWCEKVAFRQQDRIVKLPDGTFAPQTKSEDWDFSRQLRLLGCKLLATRKVQLEHERPEYTNTKPWGTWDTDRDAAFGPVATTAKPIMAKAG